MVISNSFILQWGRNEGTGIRDIYYPITFTTHFTVIATILNTYESVFGSIDTYLNRFTLLPSITDTRQDCNWIAVGY